MSLLIQGRQGGIEPDLEIFDTVISTEVCYHDVAPDILDGISSMDEIRIFYGRPKADKSVKGCC